MTAIRCPPRTGARCRLRPRSQGRPVCAPGQGRRRVSRRGSSSIACGRSPSTVSCRRRDHGARCCRISIGTWYNPPWSCIDSLRAPMPPRAMRRSGMARYSCEPRQSAKIKAGLLLSTLLAHCRNSAEALPLHCRDSVLLRKDSLSFNRNILCFNLHLWKVFCKIRNKHSTSCAFTFAALQIYNQDSSSTDL